MERGIRSCLVAVRLGEVLGLAEAELGDLYYLSLLAMLGCTADAHRAAAAFGDELAFGGQIIPVAMGGPNEVLLWMLRHFAAEEPPVRRARALTRAMATAPRMMAEAGTAHCEVAQLLADRLRFGPGVRDALGCVLERWNGSGTPLGLKGDALPIAVRVLHVAWDAEAFHHLGVQASLDAVRRRAGRAFDPAVVEALRSRATDVLEALDPPSAWDAVLAAEPGPPRLLSEVDLDPAATVLADFADLKSDHTAGHSRRVGELAAAAASRLGLDVPGVAEVRRAALVHDLGVVAVSTGIWDKPGPLGAAEWEQVRLHAYYTERILGRTRSFGDVARLASLHHERLDGSGYHRAAQASELPVAARLLAAAEAFQAMTEPRPHRSARLPAAAAEELQREADAGRLDADAARAVVEAAGQRPRASRRVWPCGLSAREVEVLGLLARGWSMREIARRLVVSPKTIDHHIQHIYDKIDVRSRAGARVFAMEHDLIDVIPAQPLPG
ncbi:MAG TPA: HD domain-containing phosphohydrolase [Chloroflexota bacterium]